MVFRLIRYSSLLQIRFDQFRFDVEKKIKQFTSI